MINEYCYFCTKPIARAFLITSEGNYIPLFKGSPEPHSFFCQGHKTIKCDKCGWEACEGFHSPDLCRQIVSFMGKRTIAPLVFYEAFAENDLQI